MVIGHTQNSQVQSNSNISIVGIVALCVFPISNSLITILLRTMKNISYHTAAFYNFILQGVIFTIIMVSQGMKDFASSFDLVDISLIIFAGITVLGY